MDNQEVILVSENLKNFTVNEFVYLFFSHMVRPQRAIVTVCVCAVLLTILKPIQLTK